MARGPSAWSTATRRTTMGTNRPGIEKQLRRWPASFGQGIKYAAPNAFGGPTLEAVVERLPLTVDGRCLKARIKEITATRVRYGYRRVHVLLRREGRPMNAKRIYRLYKELGLQIRNKTPRRRVKENLRQDRREAVHSNDVRAVDFGHDQMATGHKIRVLTAVDTFSRFSPAVDPRFSYRGEDAVATLERACRSGSEFISRDLDLWAYQRGVELDFSRPGKPTDNAFIESFNGKFRSECLNAPWFLTLDEARLKMEEWRKDCNTVRPHSAIGNKPPISLMKGSSAASAT